MKKNQFPLEIFPANIMEFVDEANKCYGYNKDFFASAILTAVSTAIGRSVIIRFNNDFMVSVLLYIVIVGKPNTGKTHPLKLALEPIIKRDSELYENYKKELAEYHQAKKDDKSLDVPAPVFMKTIIKDFTIEALCSQLKNNPRGTLLYMDEIMGWIRNMGKYTGGSDIAFYLSLWSEEDISVDRKTTDNLRISKPFLSIIGGIQTGILSELMTKDLLHQGFLDRILFVMPQELKALEWTEMSVNTELKDFYFQFIRKLFDIPVEKIGEDIVSTILDFSTEAKEYLISWRNTTHKAALQENENEYYIGAYGKMDIYVLRFSLILQMMYYAAGEEDMDKVGLRAVKGAICLADYFMQESKKVFDLVFVKDVRQEMNEQKRKFYDALPEIFRLQDGIKIGTEMGLTFNVAKKFISRNKAYFEKSQKGVYKKTFVDDEDRIHL